MKKTILFIVTILLAVLSAGCNSSKLTEQPKAEATLFAMNTYMTFTAYGEEAGAALDAAVVTSGGYENYFEDEEGHIYWHILDPATGYPAENGLQSVVIVGTEGRTETIRVLKA